MTSNQFLSHLIEKQRLTPDTVKNIVFSDAYRTKIENSEDGCQMVCRLLIDSGLMKKDEVENEIVELKTKSDFDVEETGALEKLNVMVVYSDENFGMAVKEALQEQGHSIIECRDAIEAGSEIERSPCDLLIAEYELTAVDGAELASMLLQNDRRLNAVVLASDPDKLKLDSHLYIESRFLLAKKDDSLKELFLFIKSISLKKTGLVKVTSDTATEPARVIYSDARLKDWLDEIEIEYTKDGVMLFIDPAKVPRIPDRHRLTKSEIELYNTFYHSVQNHLRKMRIEQLDIKTIELAVWYPWRAPIKIAPVQEPTRDATAYVYISEDGKRVLVDYKPPTGKGNHVKRESLRREINRNAAEFYVMEEAIDRLYAIREPVRGMPLAECRDATADIFISKDGLEATLTLQRPYGGKPIDIKDVINKINDLKITKGLKTDILKEVCFSGLWDREVVIARGIPSVNGENGKIRYVAEEKFAEQKKNEGLVDHRIVRRMNNVSAGETILSIEPPSEGKPGVNVHGEIIPAKAGVPVKYATGVKSVKDSVDFAIGDNVELVMDNKFVVSKIDGMLQKRGKLISVVPVYEIKGNVDYSVGNVDIKGAVIIHGSVLSKFEVHATGDVYILGSVEDAIVTSGGSIFVEEGIYGHEKGIVLANANVESRTVEQANVFARGSVKVQSNISHSQVVANETIDVIGQKGFVVGGSLRAGLSIAVPRLGGPSHTVTFVEVGSSINIEEDLEKLRETMLRKIIIYDLQSRSGTSSLQQKDSGEKSDAAESDSDKKEEEDKKKYGGARVKQYDRYFLDWIEKYVKENKGKRAGYKPGDNIGRNRIITEQHMYPGVQMKIRTLNFNVTNEYAGKRIFSISGDKISESV